MALDITATAPVLFLALLLIDITFNSCLDESDSFMPGTLSRCDVAFIARELGSSWEMVGRELNVPDAVIDEIKAIQSTVFEKCYRKCNCVICTVIMG